MIPQDFVQEVLDKTDIVELISSYIPLKKSGSNFKSLCPFHTEKTPSFFVSPQKQLFHCFGCGVGGNAIHFLMKYENLSFYEALKTLAERAGLKMPKIQDSQKTLKTSLYEINELTAKVYNAYLKKKGENVIKYLASRGIDKEHIDKFLLGLAPNSWDFLINFLREKNISLSLIEKAGLVSHREDGGFYDLFRNRLMIPIFDIKDRIIGFGARRLKEDANIPKYINTPQTEIYNKGKTLFGLNFSKEYILREKKICIVEGYFDMIVPFIKGLKNIVACLGTALTSDQVQLIKRYTDKVVMIYDQDDAGNLATLRALGLFLEKEIDVKVCCLPEGFDPDSFVREHGIERFKTLVNDSVDFLEFVLKILFKKFDPSQVKGKIQIIKELLPILEKIKNQILLSEYIKVISQRLNVKENSIYLELQRKNKNKSLISEEIFKSYQKFLSVERMLLKIILEFPETFSIVKEKLTIHDFEDSAVKKVLESIWDLDKIPQLKELSSIFSGDEQINNLLSEISFAEVEESKVSQILRDCVLKVSIDSKKRYCRMLKEEIEKAQREGNEKLALELLRKYNILRKVTENEKKEITKRCRENCRVK